METERRHLKPGVKINVAAKYVGLIAATLLTAFLIASMVWLAHSTRSNWGQSQLPFFGVVIWMLISALLLDRVTVTETGLDINGRTVPFKAISNIKIKSGNHARLTYQFEGDEYKTSLRTHWWSNIFLTKLCAELGAAAGLTAYVGSKPAAAQS